MNHYLFCNGWDFRKLDGITQSQALRLNNLLRRRDMLANCQHDVTAGILVTDLLGADGTEEARPGYEGPNGMAYSVGYR